MKLCHKRRLLAYIQKNNDGTSEAESLIHFLEHETRFADCDVFAVGVEDLKYLGDSEVAENLRQKLGKREGEDYTMEDCEKVANAIADVASEEFCENLLNAIEYEI